MSVTLVPHGIRASVRPAVLTSVEGARITSVALAFMGAAAAEAAREDEGNSQGD